MTTDETPQVSGEAGEPELPTPTFSDNQATSSPSEADDAIVSKLAAKLVPELEKMVEKKVQSTKDKRISKLEKEVRGKAKLLAELKDQGVAIPQEMLVEARLSELEERYQEPEAQPTAPAAAGPSVGRSAVAEAIAELKVYQLSENDPGFIEIARGSYPNKVAFDLAVQRYINSKIRPQSPPSPAGVVQPPATSSGSNGDIFTRVAHLQELQKFPSKNRDEIRKLTAELEARGWK